MFTFNPARFRHHFFPLFLLHIFVVVIFFQTLEFGKFLIGWDALNPEFNLSVNITRAIFAGWQENYGTGTLGGHGFAATLPHSLIISLLQAIFPIELVRQLFTLLCWYVGGLGMYVLLNNFLKKMKTTDYIFPWVSLVGSLFYLSNLATIQIFYLPLEAFTVHFAMLPWIFWSAELVFEKRNSRKILLFSLLSFLASVQAFIPSVFIGFMAAFTLYLIAKVLLLSDKKQSVFSAVIMFLITLVVNTYWILPFAYYVLARNDIFLSSYNNQLSTPYFVEQNQKYGNIDQVALLRSFFLEGNIFGEAVFAPLLKHINSWLWLFIGYLLVIISLMGAVYAAFAKHKKAFLPVILGGLFFFITLTTQTPPFRELTRLLYLLSPTYEQAFRTAFTKVGLGVGFLFSISLALGIVLLIRLVQSTFTTNHTVQRLHTLLFALVLSGMVYQVFPLFQGNFFYQRLQQPMPPAYESLINYMKSQPHSERIADLPVDCAEGWYSYDWGYTGSGFLWYALPQPVLSRSFDVWSDSNERYYWQLSSALRAGNFDQAKQVLDQYDAQWLIIDPNLIHCQSEKGFAYLSDFEKYLQSQPDISLQEVFSSGVSKPISLYYFNQPEIQNYIAAYSTLPTVEASEWVHVDQAFLSEGNYVSLHPTNKNFLLFPFQGLFSQRQDKSENVEMNIRESEIVFTREYSPSIEATSITMSAIQENSSEIHGKLRFTPVSNQSQEVSLILSAPKLYINNQSQPSAVTEIPLGTINTLEEVEVYINSFFQTHQGLILDTKSNNELLIVNPIDQSLLLEWNSQSAYEFQSLVTSTFESSSEISTISLTVPTTDLINTLTSDQNIEFFNIQSCSEELPLSKYQVGRENNQDQFVRIISQESAGCLEQTYSGTFFTNGVIIQTPIKHYSGNLPKITITDNFGRTLLEKYIDQEIAVIPPVSQETEYVTVQISQQSQTSNEAVSDIYRWQIFPIPFQLLSSITLTTEQPQISQSLDVESNRVNPTMYRVGVSGPSSPSTVLTLSQSYDAGWIAFPSWKFWQQYEHVKYNGWANGWLIDTVDRETGNGNSNETDNQQLTITILYWPQLLSFLGYGLLVGTFAILTLKILRKKQSLQFHLHQEP